VLCQVYLRASDPGSQWASVLAMLAREGLVTPWEGRFGLLGSRGGGFLPLEVARNTYAAQASNLKTRRPQAGLLLTRLSHLASDRAVTAMGKEADAAPASDGGDFCGFVAGCTPGASPMYVGVPTNAAVCDGPAAT